MKLPIFILLVCLVACKNSSFKQGVMDTFALDTLKDLRYDSIVPSGENSHNMLPEVRKYYLHKDSLFVREKDTFHCKEYYSYFDAQGHTKRIVFYEKNTDIIFDILMRCKGILFTKTI